MGAQAGLLLVHLSQTLRRLRNALLSLSLAILLEALVFSQKLSQVLSDMLRGARVGETASNNPVCHLFQLWSLCCSARGPTTGMGRAFLGCYRGYIRGIARNHWLDFARVHPDDAADWKR